MHSNTFGRAGSVGPRDASANDKVHEEFPIAAIIAPVIVIVLLVFSVVAFAVRRYRATARASATSHVASGDVESSGNAAASATGSSGNTSESQQQSSTEPTTESSESSPNRGGRLWRGFVRAFSPSHFSVDTLHQHLYGQPTAQRSTDPSPSDDNNNNVRTVLRRTDSGVSLRTVPEYKSQHGHDEVLLYKAVEAAAHDASAGYFTISASETDLVRDQVSPANLGANEEMPLPRRRSLTSGLFHSLRRSLPHGREGAASLPLPAHEMQQVRDEPGLLAAGSGWIDSSSSPSGMAFTPVREIETPVYESLYPSEPARQPVSGGTFPTDSTTAPAGRQAAASQRLHRRLLSNVSEHFHLGPLPSSSAQNSSSHLVLSRTFSTDSTGGASTPTGSSRPTTSSNWTQEQRRFMSSHDSLGRYGLSIHTPRGIDDSDDPLRDVSIVAASPLPPSYEGPTVTPSASAQSEEEQRNVTQQAETPSSHISPPASDSNSHTPSTPSPSPPSVEAGADP